MSVFEKNAYETYCVSSSYNFRIFDEETSKEVEFTEEEKIKFGDGYTIATVEDLKKLDFVIEGNGIKLPSNANSLEEIEFNHKEYKKRKEYYDEEEWFHSCRGSYHIGYHRCCCNNDTSCVDDKHSRATSKNRT